jgi:hypothetical protein
MILNRRQFCSYLALATLLGQLLGLVFCSDADCLQGGSDENCATLLCGLLAKHSSPATASGSGTNDSCQCFCHVLVDLPKTSLHASLLSATPLRATEILPLFSAPIRDIDHPPLV